MKYTGKMNRYERRIMNQEKLKNNMSGKGVYLYENNTNGELRLPKPTESGLTTVGPGKRFQGDSYFMKWVGHPNNFLKFIEEIIPQNPKQETTCVLEESNMNNENKLLLDQPDCVTTEGKIERVVTEPKQKPMNDNVQPTPKNPEVLLTEDPLDGVEIILG
jgi:hypothetical protein